VRAREQVEAMELGDGVVLKTTRGTVRARRVVLTVGPWWPEHAPIAAPLPLRVTRQVQFWVRPGDPEAYRPGRLPVFLRYGSNMVYGLPEAFYPGLKVAVHVKGDAASPETVDRAVHARDEAPIRAFFQRHMPGADGPLLGGARVHVHQQRRWPLRAGAPPRGGASGRRDRLLGARLQARARGR
jgi:sarcosine oxidase